MYLIFDRICNNQRCWFAALITYLHYVRIMKYISGVWEIQAHASIRSLNPMYSLYRGCNFQGAGMIHCEHPRFNSRLCPRSNSSSSNYLPTGEYRIDNFAVPAQCKSCFFVLMRTQVLFPCTRHHLFKFFFHYLSRESWAFTFRSNFHRTLIMITFSSIIANI